MNTPHSIPAKNSAPARLALDSSMGDWNVVEGSFRFWPRPLPSHQIYIFETGSGFSGPSMKPDLLQGRDITQVDLKVEHTIRRHSPRVTYTGAGVSQRPCDPKGHSKNGFLITSTFFLSPLKKGRIEEIWNFHGIAHSPFVTTKPTILLVTLFVQVSSFTLAGTMGSENS